MRLTEGAREILGQASIGMLALRSGRTGHDSPLVNPAVFSVASGALWMTTSRYASKTLMAMRDPRAAFLVDGDTRAVLIRGTLEVFDPLSVSSQVRALLGGPGYYFGMAGYALKNTPFVAGYVLDLARLPREWMPYNRVVLRLQFSRAEIADSAPFPAAQAARVPAVPAEVSRRLAGVSRGYACWIEGGMPVISPAFWDADRGVVNIAATGRRPRTGAAGTIVIESHHRFRPSMMVGACVRGTFGAVVDPAGVAERYGLDPADIPTVLELRPERVTSWRGFSVATMTPRGARQLRVAQG
ncbi:MAG: hypothetical protein ACHQ0J_03165 [Candidatus Dormibacterales bacterium]